MNLKEIVSEYKNHKDFIQALKDKLIEIGTREPDFVYNPFRTKVGCCYNGPCKMNGRFGPDCKGCIFGTALQEMGWDSEEEMRSGKWIVSLLYYYANISLPRDFGEAQDLQDIGKSWGEAIKVL